MDITSGEYVIFGDLHGRVDKAQAIYSYYGDRPDRYLSCGDEVDGLDTKATLDFTIKTMGALCVDSNHARNQINAMCHSDEEMRYIAATVTWPRTHDRVLESYGVYPTIPTPGTALKLKEKMRQAGHLDYILEAPAFIEGDDFLLLHGDVTEEPWQKQRTELETFQDSNIYISAERIMPYQLGEDVAHVIEENLTTSGLVKTLLSGHFHRGTRDLDKRKMNNGQHILLATWPKNNFVVAYETWSKQMRILEV